MTRLLRFVFLLLSVGLLAVGYFLSNLVWPAVGLCIFGVLWMVGLALRWDWISPFGLFLVFGAAVVGSYQGLSTLLIILAAISALLAWDLAEFHIRLRMASSEDNLSRLERSHLVRLFLLALVGGALCAIALNLHLKSSFEWLVILMFFVVWGMAQMVNRLIKKEE
jgi:hypothetical protein